MDPPTLMRAFVTYDRPLLEYASCVWSPHSVGQVRKIESDQPRFTKRFLCCCGWFTIFLESERLGRVKLKVDSLELRRIRLVSFMCTSYCLAWLM